MQSFVFIYFTSCYFLLHAYCEHNEGDGDYLNVWAAEILGGKAAAHRVAARHGMELVGLVGSLEDHYVLRHRRLKRSSEPAHAHHSRISADEDVRWTQQQRTRRRVKRDDAKASTKSDNFRDPLWIGQWYLREGGIGHSDLRVREAWAQGITGRNVVVTILDDGIERDHPDLVDNYDELASIDINGNDKDPMPRYDMYNENKHGTRCAGEVAAKGDNNVCMVGVAYNSKIGGVRMLDGEVNDVVEAKSLSLNPDHIDIYSASWGPDDNGQVVDGPGNLARKAFERGVVKGRNGKGSIFVWASGNGGRDKDSCACDGYTNSIYTLSVSSASQNGRKPWYLEECASTLTTTYSSGGSHEKQIVTTDLHGRCTMEHTGTSASAPLAAGLCALALEANPGLTWRDLQHVVVRTSNPAPLRNGAEDWTTNGAGRNVSHVFGFGLMDAGAMVTLAKQWKTVPEQAVWIGHYNRAVSPIPSSGSLKLDVVVDTKGEINFLEHVQAEVTLTFHPRGALKILLTSPMGTVSTLLPLRPRDNKAKLISWKFLTVHCWGENPQGKWTLEILHPESRNSGELQSWRLLLYGTSTDPLKSKGGKNSRHIVMEDDETTHRIYGRGGSETQTATSGASSAATSGTVSTPIAQMANVVTTAATALAAATSSPSCHPQCFDKCHDGTPSGCYRCKNFRLGERGDCVEKCGPSHFVQTETVQDQVLRTCFHCHTSCATCSGPKASNCLSCPQSSFLDKHGLCLPCAAPCTNCSGAPTLCTACPAGFSLADEDCLSDADGATHCKPGTYLDLSSSGATGGVGPGHCLPCHSSCSTCSGPGSNSCLSCATGSVLQNQSVCVMNCDKGFYVADGICLECSRNPIACTACKGPLASDCTSCPTGWNLGPQGCTALECGSRQFVDGVQGGICSACHASCLTCKGPQLVDCLSCPSNFHLHKGKCLQQCPTSTFLDPLSHDCKECDASCMACQSPGSHMDCTSCFRGHLLLQGVCVSGQCGVGFYQTTKGGCDKCHNSCLTCKGPGPSNCVTCQRGPFALHRPTSKCVPCCDPSAGDSDACCICRNPSVKNVCVEEERAAEMMQLNPSPLADAPILVSPSSSSSSSFPLLITVIVLLILTVPFIIFVTLQIRSQGRFCFGSHQYSPLDQGGSGPVRVRGLNNIEKITLTEEDLRDEDELSDDIYVAPNYKDSSPLCQSAYTKDSTKTNYSSSKKDSANSSSFHVPLLDKPSTDLHYT